MAEFLAHLREDGGEQTVAAHLTGTAALAARFAAAFDAAPLGEMAGLLHDIGKYSPDFQARIRDPAHSQRVDHSTAGAKVAWQQGVPYAAFAIAGHHTGLPDGGSQNDTPDTPTLFGRLKKPLPPFTAWQQQITTPAVPRSALPAFLGRDRFSDAFFTRMLYACLVDADYLDTESFMQPNAVPRGGCQPLPQLVDKMRSHAQKWLDAPTKSPLAQKRNAILRACIEQGQNRPQGLYSLTVPTGGGKTFASLAFALEQAAAQGLERVIYVIPYTSIIDQTVSVFSDILGADSVLAHHSGADFQLSEREELSPQAYRRALAAENWDAPVVVTTAVQFFESLYANRSSRCRKLHNLARSVVIFDEAQTLPLPYLRPCVAATAQLVQHYHTTAVLCTATQPVLAPLFAELSPDLTPQELCPDAGVLYAGFARTTLLDAGVLPQAALCEQLAAHNQVLCVVNRRKQAQSIYAALPPQGRFCLTTLLCAADRKAQLAQIRQRLQDGKPCRVVSTSLIEAGVDVDFPAAYRERAGLDSILQTAGRCNREGKRPAAQSPVTVFVLAETPPPAMLAQNIAALDAAQRICGKLDTPAAIHCYFDTLLYKVKSPQALDIKGILPAFEKGRDGTIFPFAAVAADFKLIQSPTRTIYLPLDGAPEGAALCAQLQNSAYSRSLYRALGQYAVAIYPQHFDALYNAGALTMVGEDAAILTDPHQYSQQTGLALEVESGSAWFV